MGSCKGKRQIIIRMEILKGGDCTKMGMFMGKISITLTVLRLNREL